jgi:hypothetical protein
MGRGSGNKYKLSFSDEDIALVRELHAKGFRVADIVAKLKRPDSTVWNLMNRLGLERRSYNGSPGSRNGSWKGGVRVDDDGYVLRWAPEHPFARESGQVLEHRLVMEKKIGRYLTKDEVVHHKDKNKANNHPDNLELFVENAEHLRHELTGRCPKWTEDGKRRIQEGVRRAIERRRSSSLQQQGNGGSSLR